MKALHGQLSFLPMLVAAVVLVGGLSGPAQAQQAEADYDVSDDSTYAEATREAFRQYRAEARQAKAEFEAGEVGSNEYRSEIAQAASDYGDAVREARDEFLDDDWDEDDYGYYDREHNYTADSGDDAGWFDGIDWW